MPQHLDLAGAVALAPEVSSHRGSDEAIKFTKRHYGECVSRHEDCSTSQESFLPARLIRVGADSSELRLERAFATPPPLYSAFSHCWGSSNPITLTSKNKEDLLNSIPWKPLPKSYQDAILVCRALNIPYLWIDSLCILQDDEDDWDNQSTIMDSIYAGSVLTICATSSRNADEAFLASRPRHSPATTIYRNDQGLPVLKARVINRCGNHSRHPEDYNPLQTRAWAVQEFEQSRRIVSFTSEEIQWTCNTWQACECAATISKHEKQPKDHFDAPSKQQLRYFQEHIRDYTPQIAVMYWMNLIQRYSLCNLTKLTDRLPALSGVARQLQQTLGSPFVAGLWTKELPQLLLWYRETPLRPMQEGQFIAPTFSWASINAGAGHYQQRVSRSHVFIKECKATLRRNNPYGEVRDGSLTLRGALLRATLLWDCSQLDTWRSCASFILEDGQLIDHVIFHADTPLAKTTLQHSSYQSEKTTRRSLSMGCDVDEGLPVHLFQLSTRGDQPRENFIPRDLFFLVLGRSDQAPRAYERIGLIRISKKEQPRERFPWMTSNRTEPKWCQGVQYQTITIL